MKKIFLLLAILALQGATAQEKTAESNFNLEPMFRVYGIMPFNFGDNYLADANKEQLSVGFNFNMFEYHNFRLIAGVDHVLYKPTDRAMTADVKRSRHTSFYGVVSYEIPIVKNLSAQPYVGGGASELYYRRSDNSTNLNDISIKKQHGSEFRAGFYLDYKVAKMLSFFTGANYVASNFTIHTAREYESYFGKSQTMQVNFGIKFGYSMKDKRKDKAAAKTAQIQ